MTKKKIDPDQVEEFNQLQDSIAEGSRLFVDRLNAWRYFMHWCSSYRDLQPGKGDADFYLTQHQSSEFAFSHDLKTYPETLILFAQNSLYECLQYMGISHITILDDGIVVHIADFEIYDFYIAGISFKILTSSAFKERLLKARDMCKQCHLVEISYTYDQITDSIKWKPVQMTDASYLVKR